MVEVYRSDGGACIVVFNGCAIRCPLVRAMHYACSCAYFSGQLVRAEYADGTTYTFQPAAPEWTPTSDEVWRT